MSVGLGQLLFRVRYALVRGHSVLRWCSTLLQSCVHRPGSVLTSGTELLKTVEYKLEN